MSKYWWLVSGLVGGMVAGLSPIGMAMNAMAGELPGLESELATGMDLPILRADGNRESAAPPLSALPLVDELSDVSPNHWAYQAVKVLIDKYGILSGDPDGKFRGNRAMTRFEFAAALAALMGQVDRFSLSEVDLDTIKRLQQSFGEALKDLETRSAEIQTLTQRLERQTFSTTTKLHTQVSSVLTNGTAAPMTTFTRVRLTLATSFQSSDKLVTQLELGNDGGDAIAAAQIRRGNRLGTLGILADGGGLDTVGVASQGQLRKLYYSFQPTEKLTVAVGTALPPSDFIDRNTFANGSGANFASSFFANNPLIVQNALDRFGGAGAAVSWQVSAPITVRGLYVAADAANPTQGLWRDRRQFSLEGEYQFPSNPVTVRLQYTNARVNGSKINAFGINSEWAWNRQFALFGRLGAGSYRGFNTALGQDLKLNPRTWAVGASVRNFLITGSTAGVALGQPFGTSQLGNATQTNFETYFSFLLNDRLNLSPSLLVVSNPDNQRGPTIWQWAMRVVFDF
jgi:S-layer homology domain/Carbohydrate-selective porin, OprB family